jgi:hypothetical protein
MTSALMRKELRECAGIAALGLVGLSWLALASIHLSPTFGLFSNARNGLGTIPFLVDSFAMNFALVAMALAIALGFKQSLGDQLGNAHLFLLHRPVGRQTIYLTKLAVGLALYFPLTALPVLVYALWAATPGTHASPFAWSMTASTWLSWLAIHLVYLGAFLSGIRPGAWMGTRLVPLAAACGLTALAAALPFIAGLLVVLLASAALVTAILFVNETRDFA